MLMGLSYEDEVPGFDLSTDDAWLPTLLAAVEARAPAPGRPGCGPPVGRALRGLPRPQRAHRGGDRPARLLLRHRVLRPRLPPGPGRGRGAPGPLAGARAVRGRQPAVRRAVRRRRRPTGAPHCLIPTRTCSASVTRRCGGSATGSSTRWSTTSRPDRRRARAAHRLARPAPGRSWAGRSRPSPETRRRPWRRWSRWPSPPCSTPIIPASSPGSPGRRPTPPCSASGWAPGSRPSPPPGAAGPGPRRVELVVLDWLRDPPRPPGRHRGHPAVRGIDGQPDRPDGRPPRGGRRRRLPVRPDPLVHRPRPGRDRVRRGPTAADR